MWMAWETASRLALVLALVVIVLGAVADPDEPGPIRSTIAVALETAPDRPRDEINIGGRSPFTGARVANLSPALADQLQIQGSDSGVVVIDVPDNSIAASFGFHPGDVIVDVNGERIEHTHDLEKVSETPARAWRVTIQRGGRRISAVFSG